MSWKKTLDDPNKLMDYRRPVFMLGVGLAYFAQRMRGQVASSMISSYVGSMGDMYGKLVPNVRLLSKPSFPTSLTSLSGAAAGGVNYLSGSDPEYSVPPEDTIPGKTPTRSKTQKVVQDVKRYVKRQTKPGSQTKSAVRWVARKLGIKTKKKKKRRS